MVLRTSRVITVYDQYGNPIPKVVDILEMRPSSRMSRSPSPYPIDYQRQNDDHFLQRREAFVDNKILFSKSIKLQKSDQKSTTDLDQSVDDSEFRLYNVKKALKRLQQSIEQKDVNKKSKALNKLKQNYNDLLPLPME